MKVGVYPGSFDPITLGHIDIIKRSSKLFDKLIVAVLINSAKTPLFSVEERVNMLKEETLFLENVEIDVFSGLLVDYMEKQKATAIVRGLRAVSDFEYEIQLAQTNHSLNSNVDTVFLTTNVQYAFLSSSVVREVASFGGELDHFVTSNVESKLREKFKQED
ncbi:MAG: coaD [Clostridiales bacterium]|jgi:pantetheine-phosphate adenylyltransferase|nr:coaD [Clostridiales bacterium]